MCVEKAINELCATMAVLWVFVLFISAIAINNNKDIISPYVFMLMMLVLAFFIAFIDPSKWSFAFALLTTIALFITSIIYDNKTCDNTKERN
jgi:Ca2+/Na+ antiporter